MNKTSALGKNGFVRLVIFFLFAVQIFVSQESWAAEKTQNGKRPATERNVLDELDPFDPNVESLLEEIDEVYEDETGKSAHLPGALDIESLFASGCYRSACKVFALVEKSEQKLYLYIDGNPVATWPVSTGTRGNRTPNFDRHPNGRIYDRYTSTKFPGGNFDGLGNMPYAVFISGGFAIHGTGRGNWPKLGRPASHGCIRLHPDNAYRFNRLVRKFGAYQVWVTVR